MKGLIEMNNPLIVIDLEEKNFENVIQSLGNELIRVGSVHRDYINSVLEKESILPTALKINGICIAIPHTDETTTIIKSNVAIGILKNPVLFGSMVDPHEKLSVNIVLLLALKDPSVQLSFLKNIVRVFQKKETISKLISAGTKENIMNVWNDIISSDELKKFDMN